MGGDGERDAPGDGAVVALGLVAVVVGVQDPVHPGDADLPQAVEAGPVPEVDQDAAGGVGRVEHNVDVAGVREAVEVRGEALNCMSG